jgi:general stress protein 26/nucleotide-binding universal stress UspA family protein
MKILLAVDDSRYSSEAVREVIERTWPPDTIVRVLSAVEDILPPTADLWYDATGSLERANQELMERFEQLSARIAESLTDAGLKAEAVVRHGDPRSVIVEEATEWSADLIVVGSHGYTGLKRLLLGSVAQSVVGHAPCSVEVVRIKPASGADDEMEPPGAQEAATEGRGADGADEAAEAKRDDSLRLKALIAGIRIAMVTTMCDDGRLRSRPTAAHAAGFDRELWFFTHAHTYKVENGERDQPVNISYADPDKEHYVSISGIGRLVQDRRKIEELWDPLYEDWFSQGLADRDLALLRVSIEEVEYWDVSESLMVRLMPQPNSAIRAKG